MAVKFKKKSGTLKLDSTIIVAVGTLILYFFPYFYQLAYVEQFEIPIDYIEINLMSVAQYWGTCIFLICLFFTLRQASLWIYNKLANYPNLRFIILCNFITFVVSYLATKVYPNAKTDNYFILIGLLLVNLWLLYKYIRERFYNINFSRIIRSGNVEEGESDIVMTAYFFLYFSIFFIFSTMAIATSVSHLQRDFFVFKNDSNKVVIRKYGSQLVCKHFNSYTSQLDSALILEKIDKENPTELRIRTFNTSLTNR